MLLAACKITLSKHDNLYRHNKSLSMKYLITGNSSGLGKALSNRYLEMGHRVYGLSRRGCDIHSERIVDRRCDLSALDTIPEHLDALLRDIDRLEVVFLNAGILGDIAKMVDTTMMDIRHIMNINVWSNKVILDWLLQSGIEIEQIVVISSGAAVNGGKGWSGYSLSKATLNMLTQLYSHEFDSTHLIALAPGLVDTAMQDYISDPREVDIDQFPGFQRLRNAKGTEAMPSPDDAAERIIGVLPGLKQFKSGSFVDIREL